MKKVEAGSLTSDQELDLLLTHRSGLPAWMPFYESMRSHFGAALGATSRHARMDYFNKLLSGVKPDPQNQGRVVYSDLGFLQLERRLSSNFEAEVGGLYSAVSGLRLHYREATGVLAQDSQDYVMTEICPWRGPLQGEVHDDNAWSRGGVAGHAGLFGRLQDLELWVQSLFSGAWISRSTLEEFSKPVTDAQGISRARGFDVPAQDGTGSTGFSFSSNSIGHLGFTGTSLWMDLDSGNYAILLTNRVHPARSDDRIRRLRREFHQALKIRE
jgi:CubicO group peptidase (beta-lactamase class C family)